MKRGQHILLLAALAAALLFSCGKSGEKVIPVSKMRLIYKDMLLADQWLESHPALYQKADTSLFYEAIFSKYGYTLADYQNSVSHYLGDPRRFGKLVGDVGKDLKKERMALSAELERDRAWRHRMDSIAEALSVYRPAHMHYLTEFLSETYRTDTMTFAVSEEGFRFPCAVAPAVRYRGPERLDPPSEAEEAPADTVRAPLAMSLEEGEELERF
ncbi:MAG: DUF4296 domain-containing protein [Bacteroidales bacterium]|nr:DUF4296 domain-containing protein [Bacteroidales bacterium]